MRKLRLVIDCDRSEEDYGGLKRWLDRRCLESLVVGRTQKENLISDKLVEFISTDDNFDKIQSLTLIRCTITETKFKKLIRVFLPHLKKLRLEFLYDPNELHQQPDGWLFKEQFQFQFLSNLVFLGCSPVYHSLLLNCNNLKTLRIFDVNAFLTDDIDDPNESLWKLAKFKLEEFEVFDFEWGASSSFLNFLKSQTSLKEFCFDFVESCRDVLPHLLQLPSLERIAIVTWCKSSEPWCWNLNGNLSAFVNMSDVPHDLLVKFKIWTKFNVDFDKDFSFWMYAPEAPKDMKTFERDILAFMDSDCDVRGLKHSEIIASVRIGQASWLEANVALSREFIADLIERLPLLTRLELYSASPMSELRKILKESKRNFNEIKLHSKAGRWRFKADSSDSLSHVPSEGKPTKCVDGWYVSGCRHKLSVQFILKAVSMEIKLQNPRSHSNGRNFLFYSTKT